VLLLYIVDGAFAFQCVGILLGSYQSKRIGLLLPASAYGLSSASSFVLTSWWPLFLGYSLARLFAVYETGVAQKPAQRLSPIDMFVNHGLHIIAGFVGSEVFLLSFEGITFLTLFAVVVQGLDTVGIYHTYTRLLSGEPRMKHELLIKLAWWFVWKTFWYGFITMLTAAFVRNFI
jgi:hypothetical protein